MRMSQAQPAPGLSFLAARSGEPDRTALGQAQEVLYHVRPFVRDLHVIVMDLQGFGSDA